MAILPNLSVMLNPAQAGLIFGILQYIPVVNPAMIAFLDLEQNLSFLDGY